MQTKRVQYKTVQCTKYATKMNMKAENSREKRTSTTIVQRNLGGRRLWLDRVPVARGF